MRKQPSDKTLIWAVLACLCVCWPQVSVASQPLPEKDGLIHLGVASCASSVCHGKTSSQQTTSVLQNEYTTWSQHDRHARAYKTLLSKDSTQIAKRLNIGPAHEAKVCLDCHSDNVDDGNRGRRFQRSDGVGCEACHGGAEKWIKTHTEPSATHTSNIESGLYPTELPSARAKLCISCHVGTQEKFATHDIMGAGHPRLSFEMDTFTVIQPKHYKADKDYIQRKGDYSSLKIWLAGQILVADHWLKLIQSPTFDGHGLFPEISFYDCHACHHAMSDERQQSGLIGKPGDMRLNDGYLQIIEAVFAVVLPKKQTAWQVNTQALLRAGQFDRQAMIKTSKTLQSLLKALEPYIEKGFNDTQQKKLLEKLLELGGNRRLLDYGTCEQIVMSISVIADNLKINKSLGNNIDKLYDSLANEASFKPKTYKKEIEAFKRKLGTINL
jgi:hypothetical protein